MNFIEFPKLGIRLFIDPVAFSLGPLSVRWYGLIISFAIAAALMLSVKQSARFCVKEDDMVDMFLWALPISIVASRLFFVAVEWKHFLQDPAGIFRIWEGGLSIYGAVIGGIFTVWGFSRARKLDVWNFLDFACVYLPFAQAIGRWGNFANQELYGGNTTLPWGMTGTLIQQYPNPGVDGALPVHPTFLYESLSNLLIFALLLWFRNRRKNTGTVLALYIMAYNLLRFGMETMRTDSFGTLLGLRTNMTVAIFGFGLGLALFIYRKVIADPPPVFGVDVDDENVTVADIPEAPVGQSAYGNVLGQLKADAAEEERRRAAELAAEQVSYTERAIGANPETLTTQESDTESGSAGEPKKEEENGLD